MPNVHANGIDIHYEITGRGEPLVLIAGIGYTLWEWHRMVPYLAEHFQVITFDNRGAGKTSKPAGPYSAQLLAEDTAGLVEALGFQRVAVIGHSMGGFIAQALTLSRPDLVQELILASTNFGGPRHIPVTPEAMAVLTDVSGDPDERFKRGILVSCAPGFGEAHPEIIDEWLEYRRQNPIEPLPYQAQLAIGLSLIPEEACFEPELKKIQAPTLILFGEHDKVVPPGNAGLLAREIPHSTIKILPGAGHFFPIETPQAAATSLIEFLKPSKEVRSIRK